MQLNKLKILILIVTAISINSYSQVGPKDFYFNAKIKIINQCKKEVKFKINDSLNFFSKENNLKLSFHQISMSSYDEQFHEIEKIQLSKNKFNLYKAGSLELKKEINFNILIEKFQIHQGQKGNITSLIMIELMKETKKMFVFFDFTNHMSDTKINFSIIFKEGTYKVNNPKNLNLIEINSTEFNRYMNKK